MDKTMVHRLGDYIREVDIRNHDLQCQKLLGLSIAKEFIPSIANIIGTDLRSYKVVKTDQFAYVPVTSRNGEKITVAHYCEQDNCIISQAYTVFEVIKKEELLPDYLMLWFRRPEFDRYARFKSHGSAREVFDWDEMCETMIPVPSIDDQRKIVKQYNSIRNRIEINKHTISKLEDAVYALYRKMFIEDIDLENLPSGWRHGKLSEIASVSSGTTCKNKSDSPSQSYKYPVAGASGIIGYSSEYNRETRILTTGRVGTLGRTSRYYSKTWCADNVLVIESKFYEYLHQILNTLDFNVLIKYGVQSLITQTELNDYPIIIPNNDALQLFEERASNIYEHIDSIIKENKLDLQIMTELV